MKLNKQKQNELEQSKNHPFSPVKNIETIEQHYLEKNNRTAKFAIPSLLVASLDAVFPQIFLLI